MEIEMRTVSLERASPFPLQLNSRISMTVAVG